MAQLIRKVKVQEDGSIYVKIGGLQLFPVTKTSLKDGDEVLFIGKNGKYKAKDGIPWQPLGIKVAESFFKPIEKKEEIDQTEDRVRIAVLNNNSGHFGSDWNLDKIYQQVDSLENGITLLKKYDNGVFEFAYKVVDNTVLYRIISKPINWHWSI